MAATLSPIDWHDLSVHPVAAAEIGPVSPSVRADQAAQLRIDAATFQRGLTLPDHPDNGDETRYSIRFASYQKALQHDSNGDVVLAEYSRLLDGLAQGTPDGLEALSLGGDRNLTNPLAAYAYDLSGADSHALAIPAAPTFVSAEAQAEMAELYWMALARDVAFSDYGSNSVIRDAISDLNSFSQSRVPTTSGAITPTTIFRDGLPGVLTGPYVSQFLLQTVPYGAQEIVQLNRARISGDDRVTTFAEWLSLQRGLSPTTPARFDSTRRYIRNGRDLAEWVHSDFPLQACLNAALIIAAQGNTLGDVTFSPAVNDPNNPYSGYQDQNGFITFGNQQFYDLIGRVLQQALQAAWYQKWLVHRRLRPEEYGGRVEGTLRRGRSYPLGDELRRSQAVARTLATFGSYLLPQAYPEGSPTHPAYPSGHSTYIAAGVTMIKAFINARLPVSNPVVPNTAGTGVVAYSGPQLMLDDELDKLVMNLGMGRLFAGVHYRSDHALGMRLGELVAIRALHDLTRTVVEPFAGFALRTFGGTDIVVTNTGITTFDSPNSVVTLPNDISAVTHFVLINADTAQPIAQFNPLGNNTTLNLAALPTRNLNIQVVTTPQFVGSVRIVRVSNGVESSRVENQAPYSVWGDNPPNYNAWTPQPGTHVFTATPLSGRDAGTGGVPLTIRLIVS